MNPPFPEAAEPVRQKIRELVKRPKELPTPALLDGCLHFPVREGFCPYVKLPGGTLTFEEGRHFTKWWDRCTEAQQAVDTVWGKAS